MSTLIAVNVLTSESTSAPPSIAPRAVSVTSSTLGESLTMSGLCGRTFFTSRVSSLSRPGCVPNVRPSLTGNSHQFESGEIAVRLGLSDGALKVVIHRLRKRFRQLVKSEIAETVDDPAEIDSEIDYLIEALSTPAT